MQRHTFTAIFTNSYYHIRATQTRKPIDTEPVPVRCVRLGDILHIVEWHIWGLGLAPLQIIPIFSGSRGSLHQREKRNVIRHVTV